MTELSLQVPYKESKSAPSFGIDIECFLILAQPTCAYLLSLSYHISTRLPPWGRLPLGSILSSFLRAFTLHRYIRFISDLLSFPVRRRICSDAFWLNLPVLIMTRLPFPESVAGSSKQWTRVINHLEICPRFGTHKVDFGLRQGRRTVIGHNSGSWPSTALIQLFIRLESHHRH